MNILTIILTMFFYLNQNARITIGKVVFDHINSVEIEENVNLLSGSAKITLPRNYQELNGKPVLDYLHVGDKVIIELGYDGNLNKEYTGYVREISSDIPIEIECDEMYLLRQNNLIKSYKTVTLRQLLTDITQGTNINQIECPEADLGKYIIDNASTYAVLRKLKEELGLYSRLYDDLLHVGFAWDWQPDFTANHTYTMHENVRKNNLKFRRESDFHVKVRVNIHHANGKVETVEYGSNNPDAAVSTINMTNRSVDDANAIAKARYRRSVYNGYTGDITGFGVPKVHAGDSLTIKDKAQPEREGTYLVEKTIIHYSQSPTGFRRNNELAYKI